MSPATDPLFPPRSERDYAAAAVETFPWPVVATYDDIHRWMDEGQAVHPVNLQGHLPFDSRSRCHYPPPLY